MLQVIPHLCYPASKKVKLTASGKEKFVFMATISLTTAQSEDVGQIQIYQTIL